MLDADRSPLTVDQARAVLAEARKDPLLHMVVGLLLLTGQRPQEVLRLRRDDLLDGGLVRTGLPGRAVRTIRAAPSAVRAVEAYLAGRPPLAAEDRLVEGWEAARMVQEVRRAADAADVRAGVHELRATAIRVVLEDGTPVHHAERYFGVRPGGLAPLLRVPEGYDRGIAQVLEATFA